MPDLSAMQAVTCSCSTTSFGMPKHHLVAIWWQSMRLAKQSASMQQHNMCLEVGFWVQVFDECHHAQNNHPFNKVAHKYSQMTPEQRRQLQVLGGTCVLTALLYHSH